MAHDGHACASKVSVLPRGDTWQFIYDPTASVPSVLAEVKNGTVEAFYVREPGGELLARVAGETRQYYFFDGLGSTQAICPASEGNPTDRYFHTPWGEPDTRNESLSGTPGNPYRYVGQLGYYTHHQDANLSDWMQLGVRFYQPEIGRFERRDPVVQLWEQYYAYSRGRPLALKDPRGLYPAIAAGSGCGAGETSETRKINSKGPYYWDLIDGQFLGANMSTCNVTITVTCHCGRTTGGTCGHWEGGTRVRISLQSGCPRALCLVLHEAIHVCTGTAVPAHGTWGHINIPECGDISYGHP